MDLWQPKQLPTDKPLKLRVGPMALHIKRIRPDELQIAVQRNPQDSDEPDARDDSFDWMRWVIDKQADMVRLQPLAPDRPVVVRPVTALKIPPQHRATFFITLPIWVGVEVGRNQSFTNLMDAPVMVLSNTWSGEPTAGQPAYSLRSRARRELGEEESAGDRAACPVLVRNDSEEMLEVEHISVDAGPLAIYDEGARLWTNQVTVTFRGADHPVRTDYGDGPPRDHAPQAALVTPARNTPEKSFLRRGVASLRAISG